MFSDAAFRELLREHLGHQLREIDFDRIVQRVRAFIAPIVVNAHIQDAFAAMQPVPSDAVLEQIPTQALYQRFKADLGAVCSEVELEQIVTFTQQAIRSEPKLHLPQHEPNGNF